MIGRPELKQLKGSLVSISYRSAGNALKMRRGVLINVSFKHVHIEMTGSSGARYHVPLEAVESVREESP